MPVIEVTKENFEQEVLKSDIPVLVDFNANWCGPCQAMKPILDELSAEDTNCKFVSVNIDDEDELAEDYYVASIPCLVLFKNGEETDRSVGRISRDDVKALIGG